MWDLIALVPDHCLSFYFDCTCLIILLVLQGKIKPFQKFCGFTVKSTKLTIWPESPKFTILLHKDKQKLQIREDIEDNSKIIFLISQ